LNQIFNYKKWLIIPVIFFIPIFEFINSNIIEKDIIMVKSFFFFIVIIFSFLFLLSFAFKFFFKKFDLFFSSLMIFIFYWLLFNHYLLNQLIIKFLEENSFTSELSLLIIFIVSYLVYKSIKNRNDKIIRFFLIFFIFLFFYNSLKLSNHLFHKETLINKEFKGIYYPDKLNKKKPNIYFFILDAMQPLKNFENFYGIDLTNHIVEFEKDGFFYFHNTTNVYDNTTHSLSTIFHLEKIFDDKGNLKKNIKNLYPTIIKDHKNSALLYNLENLGYEFKWAGNFYAYCPKFNIRYCLNPTQNQFIDYYLFINFLKQSPLVQITIKLGVLVDFDFNKFLFFELNDGIGRLINYLNKNKNLSPTFYFIHHMSPHYPYVTNSNCSYKYSHGDDNLEGYKLAYLCNLKKIKLFINYIKKNDPNSFVVFQSDHNWKMLAKNEKKNEIFSLVKLTDNCSFIDQINYNNLNILDLIFSCVSGSKKIVKR
jgi:hypothetical protein